MLENNLEQQVDRRTIVFEFRQISTTKTRDDVLTNITVE